VPELAHELSICRRIRHALRPRELVLRMSEALAV
jgi:hypothetical protein